MTDTVFLLALAIMVGIPCATILTVAWMILHRH
jgi:hypothetical protein